MRLSPSRCADGKHVRIAFFGPVYGILTVPYFLCSVLVFCLSDVFAKVRGIFMPKLLTRISPVLFFAFYAAVIIGNWICLLWLPRIHPQGLVALWLFLSYDIQILSMRRLIPQNERLSPRVRRFVDCHPLSGAASLVALLITLQYLPVLLIVFTDAGHGWPFWFGILYVYYSPLGGPVEFTEHIASHAAKGRLFVPARSFWTLPIALVDLARRYLLYPAIGFPPDHYLLTHAYHHHREENAPTDWQSTLRYPRRSIIGIAHYAFFTTLANGILPFATLLYFLQRREWKLFRRIAAVFLFQLAYYGALFWLMGPWVFVVFGARWLMMGMSYVTFSFPWHGLHSSEHCHETLSATHDPYHLVHHEYPGIHLLDMTSAQDKLDKIRSRPHFELVRMFALPGPVGQVDAAFEMFGSFLQRDRARLSKLLMSADAATSYRFPEIGAAEQLYPVNEALMTEEEFTRRLSAASESHFRVSRADAWLSFRIGGVFLSLGRLVSPTS